MLKDLALSYLTYNEMAVAAKRLSGLIGGSGVEYVFIKELCVVVESDADNLAASLNKSATSEYTAKLARKDETRDNSFITLRNYTGAFLKIPDEVKREASAKLYIEIEKLGVTLYSDGYTEQTGKMQSLIKVFSGDEYKSALTAIGATEWMEQMVTAQTEFETFYAEKTENEGIKDVLTLKEAKSALSFHLKNLLESVDSANQLKSMAYDNLVTQLNEVITDVMTTARARKSRGEKEQ